MQGGFWLCSLMTRVDIRDWTCRGGLWSCSLMTRAQVCREFYLSKSLELSICHFTLSTNREEKKKKARCVRKVKDISCTQWWFRRTGFPARRLEEKGATLNPSRKQVTANP